MTVMSAGRGGELQLQRPLQPGVEGDDGAVLLDVGGQRRALRTAQLLGPGVPVAAVLLGDRRPGRPVLQGLPLLLAPAGEGLAAAVGEEDPHQDLALARPDRVAVDQRPVVERAAGVVLEVDAVGAGHLGHPQVDRVAEAAGGRQVRAGLLPGGRGDGVQRVDQHEAGALVGGHPADGAQVGEVADAPAAAAAGGVELHGPAPGPVLGQPAPAGGDDQPAPAALGRLQPVVAEREVVGQLAVDVPHLAVLADDLGLVDLQRVAGAGDDRRAVLEVGAAACR